MKVKVNKVLEDCIERGINYGYTRAFKHDDKPSEDYIKNCIFDGVIMELYEYFDFGEVTINE